MNRAEHLRFFQEEFYFYHSPIIIFNQKQVVLVVLTQNKTIFRAGHLWFCIENSLFNRKYRKCPALKMKHLFCFLLLLQSWVALIFLRTSTLKHKTFYRQRQVLIFKHDPFLTCFPLVLTLFAKYLRATTNVPLRPFTNTSAQLGFSLSTAALKHFCFD